MMNVAQRAIQAPIHAQLPPISVANAPTGPRRAAFPIANSTSNRGTLQASRKIAHGMRKVPPPFVAAMRGNRQMFPVPTAIPSMTSSIAQRVVNVDDRSDPLTDHLHERSEAELHNPEAVRQVLDAALLSLRPE